MTAATAETLFTPAITRSTDHVYWANLPDENGIIQRCGPFLSVTRYLGVLDKSDGLVPWAARETAKAAVALSTPNNDEFNPLEALIMSVGPEGAIKALTDRSEWTRDEAAHLGTKVHALAELVAHGMPIDNPSLTPAERLRVAAYRRWWEASGWSVRLTEALVVNPSVGYGGTFDLLARDRDGRTVLADVKTGKGVYREAILQLAAYGMAPLVARLGDAIAYPMPIPDRYVILHVTKDHVREIEVNVGQAERMAFLDCVDLLRWTQSVKGRL